MAIAFVCPHCEMILRSGKEVETGRKINCPKCGESFRMSDDLIVDEGAAGAKVSVGADKPAKRRAAAREEDDGEANAAPAKPKAKKAKKPKKLQPTIMGPDGKPRRKKKKKKKPNMGLIIGAIIAGALSFFVVFAGMIYFVAFRTNLDVAMLAYAPSGVEAIVGLDIGEMANGNEKLVKEIPKIVDTFAGLDYAKLKYTGLVDADLNKILVMRSGSDEEIKAVRYNKPFDVEKLTGSLGGEKSAVGDKTVYTIKEGARTSYFFPEPDLVVFFQDRSRDDVLKRDTKKNAVPDELMPILKECWNSAAFATSPYVEGPVPSMVGYLSKSQSKPKSISVKFLPGTEMVDVEFVLGMASDEDAKSVVGDRKFGDSDKASALQKLNAIPALSPNYKKVYADSVDNAISYSSSGKRARITGKVSIEVVLRMLMQPQNWAGKPVTSLHAGGGGGGFPGPGGRGVPGGPGGPGGGAVTPAGR